MQGGVVGKKEEKGKGPRSRSSHLMTLVHPEKSKFFCGRGQALLKLLKAWFSLQTLTRRTTRPNKPFSKRRGLGGGEKGGKTYS